MEQKLNLMRKTIKGKIVFIKSREIKPGKIIVENKKLKEIIFDDDIEENQFILPGLIDSHVHIESSMMTPQNFGDAIVPHGTIGVVTDPHEITNVLGIEGFNFMINNAKESPLKAFFGVPSCVPATDFETSGAKLTANDIEPLLENDSVVALSEMMNFPGVIYKDPGVLEKITMAKKAGKVIDGHAPGLRGDDLTTYINAGISTDHEASTYEEGEEKIKKGMKILIREGSAAKNFDALWKLIEKYPDEVMLCTDDSHPDELQEKGHIDKIVRLGIAKNIDIFKLLQAACLNAIDHYNLPVGSLKEGDFADFIVVDNLQDFNVLETYINGEKVFDYQTQLSERTSHHTSLPNVFNRKKISTNDILLISQKLKESVNVIHCFDGSLLTKKEVCTLPVVNGELKSDMTQDILKLVVINRYDNTPKPAVAFIKGLMLKNGALASTVAHDSHNIIAVGSDDDLLVKAVNNIIESKGGIIAVSETKTKQLPLPLAGLMSDQPVDEMAKHYKEINDFCHNELNINMKSPFMTLSFMALPVIPEIKLSDKGLFDAISFNFTNLIND